MAPAIPQPGGIQDLSVPAIPSLQAADFSSLGLSSDLQSAGGDMAVPSPEKLQSLDLNIPSLIDPMNEISAGTAELIGIKEDPGAAAEKAVNNLSGVNTATQEVEQARQMTTNNEALQISEQIKDPTAVQETLQREATDHFAGKQEALQSSMSRISEYKRKYSSLGSLSEIKKGSWLPRNGLKGQPFRDRFRIGLHTGFKSKGDTLLLDFYPNASYRITGRLEAGLGAIYRVRLNTRDFSFDQRNPVWGVSTFAIVKTFKSIFIRFEMDGNSYPRNSSPDQSTSRDWRWTFYSGLQTNFKLAKQWTGILQMLYNFDANLKDGFPEKLAMRAGVQYRWSN